MQLIKTVSCLLAGALAMTFVSCEKEDKTISVEKIAFNETSLTLSVGQTLTPELTITPDDATDKTYILASNDEAVVTVSGSEIKAVAAGDAVITATVQGGTLTSECSVTVVPEGYPTEFTAFNSAKGFFYGDYYMAGTDNSWTYFTSGSVVFADGAFSGKGTALFLELNAPKSGGKSVTAGSYRSPRPHRSSSCWHHPVPGVINSAHLENHLADGQRFSVLGVNVFAHLRVRDPLSRARRRLPKAILSILSGIFCGVENLSLPLSRHSILSGATNP